MRAAISVNYIIGECLDCFNIGVGVLQSNFYRAVIDKPLNIKYIVTNDVFANIQMFYVRFNATVEIKGVFFTRSLIAHRRKHTFGQIRLVTQIIKYPFVVHANSLKNGRVWVKRNARASFVGLTYFVDFILWNAPLIILGVELTVPANLGMEVC